MAPKDMSYGSIQLPTKGASGDEEEPFLGQGSEGQGVHSFASQWRGRLTAGSIACACFLAYSFIHHRYIAGGGGSGNARKGPFWQGDHASQNPLFGKAPDEDLGLQGVHRAQDAVPSSIWGHHAKDGPLPTNSWYLNLVSHRAAYRPDDSTRAYTVPYIIDTAAAQDMAGIRVHWPVAQASDKNVQMVGDFKNALTLGTKDKSLSRSYQVHPDLDLSMIGVSLQWSSNSTTTNSKSTSDKNDEETTTTVTTNSDSGDNGMETYIVRGMPYATMKYSGSVLPSIYSYNGPASTPIIDGSTKMKCGLLEDGKISKSTKFQVEKNIQLHFINSDFTWMVFVSRPVHVTCGVTEGDEKVAQFLLDVVEDEGDNEESSTEPLVVRVALINQCTTGKSDIMQHCTDEAKFDDQESFVQLLQDSAHIFPTSPIVDFTYPERDDENQTAFINFDWAAQSSKAVTEDSLESNKLEDLLMFALPHHQKELVVEDKSMTQVTNHCIPTFHGSTCIVKGNKWSLQQDLSQPQSFIAKRPPAASAIPMLAEAVSEDIHTPLSDNMLRGAADTYFSSKLVAKLARTILIASELKQLADASSPSALKSVYSDFDEEHDLEKSMKAAAEASLPTDDDIQNAVKQLKKGVSIWLDDAEAPYLFDKTWGGLVNCGCHYVGKGDKGVCNNTYPDCPALVDVNEDFGNGYYNDHHFHYGYQVYTAAVVAKYDPAWGKEYFQKILLYIRDYANPSVNDSHFTPFRQKDWFLGSSWASGIVSAENSPHGRNQESSSEAIAAYEGMALYGQAMVDAFDGSSSTKAEKDAARLVRDAGELLTITEVDATNRYWHVWSSKTHNTTYPAAYKEPVVGMLYETMASFQTWFSPLPVVSYGIQLMPFTPVGEIRDDPEWASQLYPEYKKSCEAAGDFCIENGWSILQSGLCATAGDTKEALKQAAAVPTKVFLSEGGMGNSLSNTIWYIATRKSVTTTTHEKPTNE